MCNFLMNELKQILIEIKTQFVKLQTTTTKTILKKLKRSV